MAAAGVYVNYLGGEGEQRVREAYGPNLDRLAEIKSRYDPDNFFRMNQNIRPPAQRARAARVRTPAPLAHLSWAIVPAKSEPILHMLTSFIFHYLSGSYRSKTTPFLNTSVLMSFRLCLSLMSLNSGFPFPSITG